MRAIGVSMFEYVCAGACECVCVFCVGGISGKKGAEREGVNKS